MGEVRPEMSSTSEDPLGSGRSIVPILCPESQPHPISISVFQSPAHFPNTQVGQWQHANPALAGPLQSQFPLPRYMPLLVPWPGPPYARPTSTNQAGGEHSGV